MVLVGMVIVGMVVVGMIIVGMVVVIHEVVVAVKVFGAEVIVRKGNVGEVVVVSEVVVVGEVVFIGEVSEAMHVLIIGDAEKQSKPKIEKETFVVMSIKYLVFLESVLCI